jgi:hypothetical protein
MLSPSSPSATSWPLDRPRRFKAREYNPDKVDARKDRQAGLPAHSDGERHRLAERASGETITGPGHASRGRSQAERDADQEPAPRGALRLAPILDR